MRKLWVLNHIQHQLKKKLNNMIRLNLTIQETLRLHAFLESVIKIVNENPDFELIDRINTTAALENIMSKIDEQLEIIPNNN